MMGKKKKNTGFHLIFSTKAKMQMVEQGGVTDRD